MSSIMINPLNHSLADSSETFYQVSENNLTNSDRFSWCYDNSETENAFEREILNMLYIIKLSNVVDIFVCVASVPSTMYN